MSTEADIELAKRRVEVLLAELEAETAAAIEWWREYQARRQADAAKLKAPV